MSVGSSDSEVSELTLSSKCEKRYMRHKSNNEDYRGVFVEEEDAGTKTFGSGNIDENKQPTNENKETADAFDSCHLMQSKSTGLPGRCQRRSRKPQSAQFMKAAIKKIL